MFKLHYGIAALTYMSIALGFAYYDYLIRANGDLGSLIAYGATWPLHLWGAG